MTKGNSGGRLRVWYPGQRPSLPPAGVSHPHLLYTPGRRRDFHTTQVAPFGRKSSADFE